MVRLNPGLQMTTTIKDYYGNDVKVTAGIRGVTNARGYGVNIKDGQLEVVGDDYGQTMRLDEFKNRVNQAYRASVYARSLSRNGFRPQIIQQKNQFVVVGQSA